MVEGALQITYEQLQQLLAAQAQSNLEMVKTIVEEIRKPTPEQEAALQAEREIAERRRKEMVILAAEEEQRLKNDRNGCNHLKENGRASTGGQVFSDGKIREICLRCQKVVREYEPVAGSMAGGIGEVTDFFQP